MKFSVLADLNRRNRHFSKHLKNKFLIYFILSLFLYLGLMECMQYTVDYGRTKLHYVNAARKAPFFYKSQRLTIVLANTMVS